MSTNLKELLNKIGKTDGYDYVKDRIDDELKKLYKETIGKIFPSILSEFPMAIINAVVDDDRFWNETIFIGISNYIKSKKAPIIEILNLLENDLFSIEDFGSTLVRQTLAGSIAQSEKDEFYAEPIKWLKEWLESEENITVSSTDDVKHSVNNIVFALIILIVLVLIFYLIFTRPKLNIGGTAKILIENIFNNVRYNDKSITGGLIKSILNVVDSWIKGDEEAKLLKNLYILLNEINKVAKSVSYLNTSLAREYSEDELNTRKYKIKNKRINDELTTFTTAIGKNASKILSNVLKKGGLWKGDMMDYILADLIYARIHVSLEGDTPKFTKREGIEIIDWTDKESRNQHPLSKTMENLNKITAGEIKADIWQKSFMGLFGYLDKGDTTLNKSNFFLNEISEYYDHLKSSSLKKLKKAEIIKELNTSNDKLDKFKKELKAIIEKFTFHDFHEVFGMDFVVSGSNITSAQPVYFNHTITPTMSVVRAVRISSNFPFLFQPIKLKHTEKEVNPKINFTESENVETWIKNKEDYYKKHYTGFFLDGGLLNNFPMNAFNSDGSSDVLLRDPKSKLDLPPNNKVFGLKLGGLHLEDSRILEKKFALLRKNAAEGEDKRLDQYSHDLGTGITKKIPLANPKFTREKYKFSYPDKETYQDFEKNHLNKKDQKLNDKGLGILDIITNMFGTTLDDSMDGRNSAFYDKNEQIVRLYTGRISLFDLVTKESELTLVDLFSYSEVYKHFSMLDALSDGWEKNLIIKLRRNTYLKNKWRRYTRDRNRLQLRRRHI